MRPTVLSRFLSTASTASTACAASTESTPFRVACTAAAAAALLAVAGCSSWFPEPTTTRGMVAFFAPYRPDIVQGNVVTEEQLAQVKPGMTRVQVRDILGTPLLSDPFHAQRWDYVFTMVRQGYASIQRKFTVVFENDAVQKIDSPELPTEDQFVADISRRPLPKTVPKLELTDAERAALPPPRVEAQAASAAAPAGPTRTYPPLESH
jgi:outer membrane protein assembly factor BamE